jgi:Transposase DNA-binding/Transposase Tn5 dimerisation domain
MFNRLEVTRMSSPSPLPHPIENGELWAAHLAGHADLPDQRLDERLSVVLAALAAKPADSIPQASGSSGQAKAMYRFFANDRVEADDLLQPITDTTVEAVRGLTTVLAVQDTTSLNYSTLQSTTGLGPLNDSSRARGLHLHTNIAVRHDGVAIGILDQKYWARPAEKRAAKERNHLPIDQKESCKWLDSIEAAEARIEALPPEQRPRLIHVMDREGDIHEVLERLSESPHGAIIRCAQNRSVAGDVNKAFAAVEAAPILATSTIDAPGTMPASPVAPRSVTLALRVATLTITPNKKKHPRRQPVTWTLLDAREVNAAEGVEALHWRLWTKESAATVEDCLAILRYYRFRWRIEDFHLTLKSGCQVEKLELETADRLIKAATLYSAVAVRIVAIRDLARLTPDAPCTVILTPDEWQSLYVRFSKQKLTAATPPPTLQQAVKWIGRLGGHLGRKRDGMPGVRTLWRGFRDLSLLAAGFYAGRISR